MKLNEALLDKQLMDEIKDILIQTLTQDGVDKMFGGDGTAGFAEAKAAIERAFVVMEDLSGRDKKPQVINSSPR